MVYPLMLNLTDRQYRFDELPVGRDFTIRPNIIGTSYNEFL